MTGGTVPNDIQRVIEYIAANRFPFPGQTDWPQGYRTVVNGNRRGVSLALEGGGEHWPAIVILDENGAPCRLGELDETIDEAAAHRWAFSSSRADTMNETGVRNLFVYVPAGRARAALELLDRHAISFAGLREFSVDGEDISVTPFVTRGDRYDHQ